MLRFWILASGLRASGVRFWVSGFRFQGFGSWMSDFGFRASGYVRKVLSGLRVSGFEFRDYRGRFRPSTGCRSCRPAGSRSASSGWGLEFRDEGLEIGGFGIRIWDFVFGIRFWG